MIFIVVLLAGKQLVGIIDIIEIQVQGRRSRMFEMGSILPLFAVNRVTVGGVPIIAGHLADGMLVRQSRFDDMAPWDSPAAFKNGEPFTGGADDYLRLLVEEIIQGRERATRASGMAWDRRVLSGRAVCPVRHLPDGCVLQGGVHVRFPVVSWFQRICFSHEPKRRPDCIYFSLGDKEVKTRNPVLKTVQENTEEIQAFYQNKGIDTVFHLNPGNHFVQGIERTIACIQRLLSK